MKAFCQNRNAPTEINPNNSNSNSKRGSQTCHQGRSSQIKVPSGNSFGSAEGLRVSGRSKTRLFSSWMSKLNSSALPQKGRRHHLRGCSLNRILLVELGGRSTAGNSGV